MRKLFIKVIGLIIVIYSYSATADTKFLDISGSLAVDNNQQTSSIIAIPVAFNVEISGINTAYVIQNFTEVSGLNIDNMLFQTTDTTWRMKINTETGLVKGQSRGLIPDLSNKPLYFQTRLEGHLICIDPGENPCLVTMIDMQSTGVIFDGKGQGRVAVGTIREQLVGTFFTGDTNEPPELRSLESTGTYSINQ